MAAVWAEDCDGRNSGPMCFISWQQPTANCLCVYHHFCCCVWNAHCFISIYDSFCHISICLHRHTPGPFCGLVMNNSVWHQAATASSEASPPPFSPLDAIDS